MKRITWRKVDPHVFQANLTVAELPSMLRCSAERLGESSQVTVAIGTKYDKASIMRVVLAPASAISHPPIDGPNSLPTLKTIEKLAIYGASWSGRSMSNAEYLLRAVSSKLLEIPIKRVLVGVQLLAYDHQIWGLPMLPKGPRKIAPTGRE